MQTCPDCHTQVEDHVIFCENCGFRLLPDEIEPSPPIGGLPAPSMEAALPSPKPLGESLEAPQGACSACGYINLPGETFCSNCGVQLAPVVSIPPPPPVPVPSPEPDIREAAAPQVTTSPQACTYCGYTNDPGEAYCMNCGLQLAPASVPSATPPIPTPPQPAAFFKNTSSPPLEYPAPALAAKPPIEEPAPSPIVQPPEEFPPISDLDRASRKLLVGEAGAEIILPPGKFELLIGRSDPVKNVFPDVDLTLYGGELNGVSRIHAKLEIQGDEVTIEDLNSTNYTFLNRQKLQPGTKYPIHPGDEICLGLLRIEFVTF